MMIGSGIGGAIALGLGSRITAPHGGITKAIAPPIPDPIIIEGITRNGSAAANGIAPSVIN
jgi:fructose-specific phosphotransferase system IIC component